MKYPFEDFLKECHAEDYIGTDDEMPEAYENWLTQLEPDMLIAFGNQFGNMLLGINKK